jgi:hypothetical protein
MAMGISHVSGKARPESGRFANPRFVHIIFVFIFILTLRTDLCCLLFAYYATSLLHVRCIR